MMNSIEYVSQRGDVIWINFNPQAGHEQAGRRPPVVLSLEFTTEKLAYANPNTDVTVLENEINQWYTHYAI